MHGVFITEGVSDWQIVQHKNHSAILKFAGTWKVPKAAITVGTKSAVPVIRVMHENDNSQVIPWTKTQYKQGENQYCGSWKVEIQVTAGGLYRIETGLDTKSTNPDLGWIFRGDVRMHVGVGDIFVIAGQSNSSGYGRDSAFDPPMPGIHLYRNRRKWDLACHPMNESTFAANEVNAEMGVSGVSPYLSFGKRFREISGYPVGLIQTSLGGSTINRWHSERDGDLFWNMIARIRECGGEAAGVLWYQGCSDAIPDVAKNYLDNFKHVVNTTRKELGFDIPFFTFQLNRQINGQYDECWGMVRDAQRIACHQIPEVYMLPTLNCPLSDGIHNSAHSNMMLGEKMARLCGNILYHTPKFRAPELLSASCDNLTLHLTFGNMKRGFMIYSHAPADCGFMVKDSSGNIPVIAFYADKEQLNVLHLTLERPPLDDATISFAWEANPVINPPVDEVTYLPIISFYKIPLKNKIQEVHINE